MNSKPDILIVGGGVIGVCSAYFLAQKGAQVAIVEKDEIASGCSYGNGGLIVPSHSVPLASPGALGDGLRWLFDSESPFYVKPRVDAELIRWALRFMSDSRAKRMLESLPVLRDLLFASRALYEELAKNAGFDFGFEGRGSLLVCLSKEALEKERRETQLCERFKIPASVVNREEALAIEPALLPGIAGGVYYPRDGRIDPRRFVVGLAEKAEELGVQVHTKTEALGFESKSGRVAVVHTTRGEFHPQQVILTSGAWSPGLSRLLNLRIPIQAAKGYSVTLENPPLTPKLPLLFSEARVAINPLGYALRIAGTLELAGLDFSLNLRRVRAMQRSSANYLPGLAEAKIIEIWRGLRPCTPDGLPILSRVKKYDNLIVAAGHAMLGMSLGPITGKLVSQLTLDKQTDVNLVPFDANRF
ncbi:MAG: FAD-dependent oxidoreductase [Anaerolineales bacterium]|nr:FAD-dependent oxidoreductase [Anaerolineales bacterium]